MSGQDGPRINLERASILLLDTNLQGLAILAQIINGFGARTVHRCKSVLVARDVLKDNEVDLIVSEADLTGPTDGYAFINWLRRANVGSNTFAPVIMVSGHTRRDNVTRARDCGANFIIAKPVAPAVMLERILWVAREARQFVRSEGYCGPDRRFKNEGPPAGVDPRRHDDPPREGVVVVGADISDYDRFDSAAAPS